MRVSTSFLSSTSVGAMTEQQSKLNKTQLKVSLGQRLLSPSEDPYASSRALRFEESLAVFTQFGVNASYADNRLATQEGVLEGVNDALQRVRELTINANSDSQTNESRRFIAEEIKQIYLQVLDLANSKDATNEYLFSGFQGKTRPFVPDSVTGQVLYKGDDGQRFLKIGPSTSVPVSDAGEAVFYHVRNGNGTFTTGDFATNTGTGIIDPGSVGSNYVPEDYTIKFTGPTVPPNNPDDPVEYYVYDRNDIIVAPPASAGLARAVYEVTDLLTFGGVQYQEDALISGLDANGAFVSISGEPAPGDMYEVKRSNYQDMFTTLDNLVNALETNLNTDADRTQFHNAMNRVVSDLDQALGNILDSRARVGARLNTTGKQMEINESFTLQMEKTLSEIKDLDYAEAVTDLNLQLAGLQAAQQAYVKVQGLSLFNYL
ncbi:MAG: flagellar hook-associated protein FlgL [Gammaproteobacteria bacterium]|nr:flagellar hook-associated protein FlgL [Gammaproteobacteria bacterium]